MRAIQLFRAVLSVGILRKVEENASEFHAKLCQVKVNWRILWLIYFEGLKKANSPD
jgi:hypothetical protein